MKYIIVLFLLFCFNNNKIFGQEIKFPIENASWIISNYSDSDDITLHFSYTLEGDTSILGLDYSKLFFENKEVGYLRESSNKVFFVAKNEIEEDILYDFTMEVGDTIRGYLQLLSDTGNADLFTIVSEIRDTILNDGLIRKKWILKTIEKETNVVWSNSLSIIEGIGSEHDLLEVLNLINIIGPGGELTIWVRLECFIINKEIIYDGYGYGSVSYCQEVVDAVKNFSYNPIIIQNPVQDFIKIRLDDKIESLELYDIQGKLVLNDKNPRSVTDVSFLKSGLYFMKVKTNDMTYLNKMVKE